MLNEKIVKVKIIGSDYSSISDASISFSYDNNSNIKLFDGDGENSNTIINRETFKSKEDFIKSLLEYIAPNGMLNNSEQYFVNARHKDIEKYVLWNVVPPSNIMFSGVVGVIRFKVDESKLIKFFSAPTIQQVENVDNNTNIIYDVTLEIQTRFDVDKMSGKNYKPYFLTTLLLRDKIRLTNSTVPLDEESIYDYLLLFWYKEHFSNAIQKGLYRTYRRFERNDDRLKGTIDIARHIKLNTGKDNGKIAYSFREYTVDNLVNYLIVKAYECLKRKYYDLVIENFDNDIELKGTLDFLRNQISDYDLNNNYLIGKNLKSIAHPYYSEYEELRKVCIMILRDEGITIFDANTDAEIQGILFYIPDLWEMYLESKLDEIDNINYDNQSKNYIFGINKNEKIIYKQQTRPDYLFYKDKSHSDVSLVLDAKFKPAWSRIMLYGKIGSQLPDFDKCIRDMVVNNCLATGVIFPSNTDDIEIANENQNDEDNIQDNFTIDVNNEEISNMAKSYFENSFKYEHPVSEDASDKIFYTVPVFVPYSSDDNYEDWKKKFDPNINNAMQFIVNIIKNENNRQIENSNRH